MFETIRGRWSTDIHSLETLILPACATSATTAVAYVSFRHQEWIGATALGPSDVFMISV